jgi:2-dehydropantoate 2-reductase
VKLLIWGAGAIGGTIGAFLSRSGHEVTLVDKAVDHVTAIRDSGLKIEGPVATLDEKIPAFTPGEIAGRWPTVLLCVKAQDTAAAAQALLPHLASSGYVVSAQNGLNETVISEFVGASRTVGAFVNFGADYLEPGVVMYGGRGAVVVGELDGSVSTRTQILRGVLSDFEPNAIATSNIWGFLWSKLAYGAQLFVTALTNETIAGLLGNNGYRPIFVGIASEALAVAAAHGISPEPFRGFNPHAFEPNADPAFTAACMEEMVALANDSAKKRSGIWRDLAVRRRNTEVDALLGSIVRHGDEASIATPLTSRSMALIKEIESGLRTMSLSNLDELLGMAEEG